MVFSEYLMKKQMDLARSLGLSFPTFLLWVTTLKQLKPWPLAVTHEGKEKNVATLFATVTLRLGTP